MKRRTKVLALLVLILLVLAGQSSAQDNMGRYIVTIQGPPGPAEQAVLNAGGAVDHVYDIIPAIAIRIPEAALQGLSRNPRVVLIEPDIEVYAIDGELDNSWGVKHIGAGIVHDGGNKGAGVKVAVIDTGIYYTHPDLDGNYAGGRDFVNKDDDPMDDNGHGTHCAGIIAAEYNGSGVVGVAPEAQLYALKVLDSSGSGYFSDVIAALDWAVKNRIQITSNSYGSSRDPGSAVKAAFDKAYYTYGIINVCAAGNSGKSNGTGDNVNYPARYDSCIAVAATDSSDKRASWSSTGPAVELSAPGVYIYSTYLNNGYATASGTSMACPHVAGTAALVIAAGRGGVRAILQETADDLGATGRDNLYGYGLVDADEAASTTVPPEENKPPVASFTWYTTGLTAYFTDTSTDPDGTVVSWSWNFGDESTSTEKNPTHTYTTPGEYHVTLTVTDDDGATGSAYADVYVSAPVENQAPVADFTYTVDGLNCSFDASASYDPDGSINIYAWNFGDGSTGSGVTASHSYAEDGTYTVSLTVTDNDGATNTTSQNVTVSSGSTGDFTLEAIGYKVRGRKTTDLIWSGATSTNVDIYRDGKKITTTENDGLYTDATSSVGGGSYTYQVCEAGTSTCSNEVTVYY